MSFRNILDPRIPCSTCRNHGDQMMKQALLNLSTLCRDFHPAEEHRHQERLPWHIHSSCRYQISCPDLRQFDMECKRIAEDMDEKLIAIATEHSPLYHKVLGYLQGNFPAVHAALERIYYQNKE